MNETIGSRERRRSGILRTAIASVKGCDARLWITRDPLIARGGSGAERRRNCSFCNEKVQMSVGTLGDKEDEVTLTCAHCGSMTS